MIRREGERQRESDGEGCRGEFVGGLIFVWRAKEKDETNVPR